MRLGQDGFGVRHQIKERRHNANLLVRSFHWGYRRIHCCGDFQQALQVAIRKEVTTAETMPHPSGDDMVRAAREQRQKQVQECSRRAAKKILWKRKDSLPEAALAEWIAGEFEEMAR